MATDEGNFSRTTPLPLSIKGGHAETAGACDRYCQEGKEGSLQSSVGSGGSQAKPPRSKFGQKPEWEKDKVILI